MNEHITLKNTRQKGSEAESMAVEFLEKKNFEIIKRNFQFGRYGELDIVAKDKNVLVFVEVRSRKSKEYGEPISSITYSKQKNLRRAAEGYLYVNKIVNQECRFDVISIDFSSGKPVIEHFINAM